MIMISLAKLDPGTLRQHGRLYEFHNSFLHLFQV